MNRIEDEPKAPVAAAVAWRILDALGASPETHDPGVLAQVARFLKNMGALFAFAAREGLCLEWGPVKLRGRKRSTRHIPLMARS